MHKITFQSALLLFRMKTVLDLECLIEEYKNDLSEHGALTAPVLRNGLVLYINYKLTNDNPNETAKIVEKLATEHINLKALCTSIRCLLQIVKDMKKHLSRAWDDIVLYLNLPFGLPFDNPQSTCTYPTFSLSVHSVHSSQPSTSCPMPTKLRSDCSNCGKRRSAVQQLLTSNEALKAKLRVLAAVKMQNCSL